MDEFMQAAIDEARQGLAEGGIPIGSVIVHQGRIIGRGHNRRVQKGSAILHGEMDAFENAGRQPASRPITPRKNGSASSARRGRKCPRPPTPSPPPAASGCPRRWCR